jgi:uncharacterized ion transporter superfamily protein YfcC
VSPVSGDLLGAASLIVTAVTLLYTAWYAETQTALLTKKERFREDRGTQITNLKATLFSRSIPLAAATFAIVLVLAPPAVDTLRGALLDGWGRPYDAISACFVVVWILAGLLGGSVAAAGLRLKKMIRDFERPDR